jgi:serine/threonine-protein kinase
MDRFGKYILIKRIAEGGMGEVFLARQRGLADVERMVVLKRIRPALRHDDKFETLFLSEARISARLNHPNVVQLYEFGRIDESYFLTFEQVRGYDLAFMRRKHPTAWPVEVVCELAVQLLAGLKHVHGLRDFDGRHLGIVHRDISPPNVMISFEGTAKLLDFGVARSAADPTDAERMIHGKFPYLSPEQCNFESLDARSDLFSLGSVLYELLTGEQGFAKGTRQETMAAILKRRLPPPSSMVPELPPVFDELLDRALSKDREARFGSAEEMQGEIERAMTVLGLARGSRVLTRFLEVLVQTVQGGVPPSNPDIRRPASATAPVVRNLLLVDDDEENLQALRRTFRSRFNLFATTDPREAIKILEDNLIHIIVTDQRMPHMTGVELLAHANRVRPGILKVITSALSDSPTLLDAINSCGIHRYIVKPWQPNELRQIVEELVAEKAGSSVELTARRLEREVAELSARSENADPTIVEQHPRSRQRLRPELVRALEESHRVGLVLIGLERADPSAAAEVAKMLPLYVAPPDVVVPVSDEKVAAVLVDPPPDDQGTAANGIDDKLERLRMGLNTMQERGIPTLAMVATILPDDATDPDEALMRASTALVIAKKQLRTSP